MTRRLLGPVCGPIVFFLVAALVFAGLGWVTHSAIGVEKAQREAAARAELGNNLRVALWRLDGRMLPALGVEDSRPYYHYSPPEPAATPLLVANLPDWMKLHFQLDPIDGWCSPQVLDTATADHVREAWGEVETRNLLGERSAVLSDLKSRYPARDTLDRFAATDRAIPADSLSLAAPILSGDVQPPADSRPIQIPPSLNNPAEKPAPATSPEPKPNFNSPLPGASQEALADAFRLFGWELICPRNDYQNNTLRQIDQLQLTNNFKKAGDQNYAPNQRGNSQSPGASRGGGRMTQPDVESEKKVADWFNRAGIIDRALREAKSAAEHQMPKGQQPVPPGMNYSQLEGRNTGNSVGKLETGNSQYVPAAGGAGNSGPPGLPPGGSGGAKDDKSKGSKGLSDKDANGVDTTQAGNLSKERLQAAEQEALKLQRDTEKAKVALELFDRFASLGVPRFRGAKKDGKETVPSVNTPVSEITPPVTPASTQPIAIHLGSMRPHWVTAPDGSDMLVLVRAALIDGKTVYQGVVVDWVKLEAALKEEVQDLFPDAKLVPVKDSSAVFPDRAMTALPVQLDPGPDAALPPTGWTTLRIGLVLSWVAAIIAFAAVGFAGWSLVDLAERRIRFVSAVTHELRTPLTSLRLYLDLLVSGMIQDEEKRREYLDTLAIESDRLHRLVDNVLDFARLEKRQKNGDIRPVLVNEITDTLRQIWTDRVAHDGKELVVISTLPETREVKTDPAMIQQIVGNLIDNARKYTREAIDQRIWVWAKPGTGDAVVFEVEDRGPGVPAGERKSIFKPFRRGEQADSKAGGAGLGLALAKSWADVLGAKLTYRSAEGGTGACFRLELPGK